MLIRQIALAILGASAGVTIAGGLFSFIIGLGVVSDFADRTHTGSCILLYEDMIVLGGMVGSIISIYHLAIPGLQYMMGFIGVCVGIFVGCWAMALAEILDIFPIFIRRTKLLRAIPYLILSIAIGKGVGSLLFFTQGW